MTIGVSGLAGMAKIGQRLGATDGTCRSGAKKLHPDLNLRNEKAEEQLKEVVQASGGAVMVKSSAPCQALMRSISERGGTCGF